MIPLNDDQKAEYFRRSYTAIDGLWFTKLEERDGFEAALEVDEAVWQEIPRIQARKIKEFTGLSEGLDALMECFTTRMSIEGFTFDAVWHPDDKGFSVTIKRCPWFDILVNTGREHLAGRIAERICNAECKAWAAEFGEQITSQIEGMLCKGWEGCTIRFRTP